MILNYPYTEEELLHLLANDDDPFNRWEAGAAPCDRDHPLQGRQAERPPFLAAIRAVLRNPDHAFVAEVLSLPSETFLAEQLEVVDPDALHAARNALRRTLAAALRQEFLGLYLSLAATGPYSPDAASAGRRALRNLALALPDGTGDRGHRRAVLRAVRQGGQHDRPVRGARLSCQQQLRRNARPRSTVSTAAGRTNP